MTGRISCLALILAVGFSALTTVAQEAAAKEEVLTVREFLALKEKWPRLEAIQFDLTVEGRIGARSDTQFRLRKCDIFFRAEPKKQLPPISSKAENVIATGYLEKRGSRYSFIVTKLKAQPSDAETLRDRRLTLSDKEPGPWYAVAKWARDRAEFYDDKELLEKAQAVALRGVQLERSGVRSGDGEAILKLAAKAASWKLAANVRMEMLHEGHRLRWAAHLKAGKPTFTELGTGLTNDLPGATKVLKQYPTKLAGDYANNPFTTYRDAKEEDRPVLHRLFYVAVLQRQIESTAKPDGSDGYVIAAALERQAPDLPDRAEFHRKRELNYRLANLEKTGRDGAVALAEMLRKRKEPERATSVLKTWLKAKEPALRKEGATGLIHLSDETMRLLNDRNRAIELLKEADRRQPNLETITDRMRKFGFRRHGNAWITTDEFTKLPVDNATKQARSGQVTAGMSPAEVRRVIAGNPVSIMRSVTHKQVHEVWVYRQPDGTRIVVQFVRKSGEPRDQAKVAKAVVSAD